MCSRAAVEPVAESAPVLRIEVSNLTQDRSIPMTTERMNPLRRRMIEDMTIRGHGEKTKLDDLRAIRRSTESLSRLIRDCLRKL